MRKYWKSIEEYKGNEVIKEDEVKPSTNSGVSLINMLEEKTMSSRRNFLKFFGFTISSAALAASCERPVKKAIPYLVKPEEITTGKASYYASTFWDGNEYCPILVKVRDGRPIKIEGNTFSKITDGGTNAVTQASLLNLYDNAREQFPKISGDKTTWEAIDKAITDELSKVKASGKKIVILTSPIISPTTLAVVNEFKSKYANVETVTYEPVSYSAILEANKLNFNSAVIPSYKFNKANVIVSFSADFLGTWLSPVEYTKQYAETRKLTTDKKSISKHYQIEAGMSLTGSNADVRIPAKPTQEKLILANIYNTLAKELGAERYAVPTCEVETDTIVHDLLHNKGKSIVISGSNDINTQLIVNAINQLLENYGKTIDVTRPLKTKQGIDSNISVLLDDMNSGKVGALLLNEINPVYDYPNNTEFLEALKKVECTISFNSTANESVEKVKYSCPNNHYLESWNDFEPYEGQLSLSQPALHPIFDTRQFQESLLIWSGNTVGYYDYIKNYWQKNIYPKANSKYDPELFWTYSLQDGIVELPINENGHSKYITQSMVKVFDSVEALNEGIELSLYEGIAVRNGYHANNPWLQELPDPVSKVTWDNFAAISPKFAEEQGLETGDILKINNAIEVPVLIQPGQAYYSISIALGYGRTHSGKVGKGVGINAYPLVNIDGDNKLYTSKNVTIEKVGEDFEFAMTQTHHSMEGRAIIRETSLEKYLENPASGNEMHEEIEHHHTTMYKKYEYNGHHWGMAIDLNACTGCSACVVACNAENNVPVVGKNEVKRAHEMHWIRIDRYYSENPENPQVVRQPVMCQHCDNAPCENVCPVGATNHSSEGINQMAYNRCIGTRYCNNNCPYKVRRFNFFDYTTADSIPNNTVDPAGMTLDLRRMVLNPDVVVRAKGVIEKCSFCVQRIQEKKLTAKLENRTLVDGEIKTACQQSCPANAIVFGDLNDENSEVSKLFKNERNYHLLEEIHTLPSVGYLTKVRNSDSDHNKSYSHEPEEGHETKHEESHHS